MTQGISKVEAPRQFKVWLYRVALHSSLNLKQARARRVELARRLAVSPLTEVAPVDLEERAALMQSIGELDDPTRCLLLEHYFDKLTLEEIGAREGVSSVAVWKRVDRAKDQLRRALIGAGFTTAGAGVANSLESMTPVVAPASLAAKSALIAGGFAVGTKSALTAGGIIAALLLIGATASGGYFVGGTFAPKRRAPSEEAPMIAANPSRQTAAASNSATQDPPLAAKLEEPIAESEPEPDWNTVAKEAFDLQTNFRRGRIPVNKMQFTEMYARLNEKTGPWFAKKYRDALEATKAAIEKGDPRWDRPMEELSIAMELCSLSGGPDVSALLLERLTASERPQYEFANLSMMLGGISGWFPWDKIPVSAAHHDAALKLAQSSNEHDFRIAIGVLGRFETPDARRFLTETFQNHSSEMMRLTAAHALGGTGDASTLALLKAAALGNTAESRMGKLIAGSIGRLEKKLGAVR